LQYVLGRRDTFDELSPDVKSAFKITALIHRFNIPCPVTILKNSLKMYDWNEFTEKIVKGDGKRILFQESKATVNDEPDLYFKTKHPVIAEALIKTTMTNNEKNSLYKSIYSNLIYSEYNAGLIVDLIKNIRNNDNDISDGQIENYYELSKKEFAKSPHFMLSYITNIEKHTISIATLENCIDEIKILEADLPRRNHRLIHRKGSICFKIARLYYNNDKSNKNIKFYLDEAEEWFDIKKHLDPLSPYSYLEYFNLLLWKLKHFKLDNIQKISLHFVINDLFDEAYRTLYSNTGIIDDLFDEYDSIAGIRTINGDYLQFLLERYQNPESRTTASILLFYYYESINDHYKKFQFFQELEDYTDDKDVVYFLFKQYGRNLHFPNNRVKYFDLIRKNSFLINDAPLRYSYFTSICEFYNWKWRDGKDVLNELKQDKFYNINPDFFLYWRNSDGEEEIFNGIITREKKYKMVKIISPFYKDFFLVKGNYEKYQEGKNVQVKLKFFLEGIRAEIL